MDNVPLRVALLGVGTIGRELIRRTMGDPGFGYVALGDTSGTIVRESPFSVERLREIVGLKESGGRLGDLDGDHEHYERMEDALCGCGADALVDATDAQTYNLLYRALDHAHVIVANKAPLADVPYHRFRALVSKAREEGRVLDFGTTVGAGLRIPDLIGRMGLGGVERLTGCLSGTMSYVSQRLNRGGLMSKAIREAMEPPRCYAEPDPRVDLGGDDFARKLVIIGRICGRRVEREMIEVEDIVPDRLKKLPLGDFVDVLEELDPWTRERMERAKGRGMMSWYVGSADLMEDRYTIGFEDVPVGDPIASAEESDNVLKIYPSHWRRMITIIGPGAGPPETVTGLIHGLRAV